MAATAAVLASSHGCYYHNYQGGVALDNLISFSATVSTHNKLPHLSTRDFPTATRSLRFRGTNGLVQARQTIESSSSDGLVTNGRPSTTKVVPSSNPKQLQGNRSRTTSINKGDAQKRLVNGTSLVKTTGTFPAPINTPRTYKELPPLEELKVLPSDESFSWANDNYNSLQRSIDVWSFVLSLRVRVLLDNAKWAYIGGFTEEKQKNRRRKTASWLRECVLQLGPTFIKLGQLSSTRSDLFPQEFVDELAKLQDRVPAFSPEKARNFIENELGTPVDVLFKEFEDRPIAAASLGQVHRAILHNGEKVVVKVQRPGLKKLFDIDLRNLKLIADYFQKSETLGGPTRDWLGIYEECATILYQEIDYINEGKNADRFRRDFRNVKWVRVPLVFWDYTATKVLTLEYVPGIKINNLEVIDARGYDRSLISSRSIEAYLIQDALPPKEMNQAEKHCKMADVVLCLGTSLQITPACNLPLRCSRRGGKVVIVNLQDTPKDKKASLVIHGRVDEVIAGVFRLLNLRISPYVRIDFFQIIIKQCHRSTDQRYAKWNLRIGSVHGQKASLPFLQSVEVYFPERPELKSAVLQKQPFQLKREMLKTRPVKLLLKLNFGDGCGCPCISIDVPINFELLPENFKHEKDTVLQKLRDTAIRDLSCGQYEVVERESVLAPRSDVTVYAIVTNIVEYDLNSRENGIISNSNGNFLKRCHNGKSTEDEASPKRPKAEGC